MSAVHSVLLVALSYFVVRSLRRLARAASLAVPATFPFHAISIRPLPSPSLALFLSR